jgi:hypothetical protein
MYLMLAVVFDMIFFKKKSDVSRDDMSFKIVGIAWRRCVHFCVTVLTVITPGFETLVWVAANA